MTTDRVALVERLLPDASTDPSTVAARDWLRTNGLPDPDEESWRYFPVNEVVSLLAGAAPATPRPISRTDVDRLAGDHGPTRLVFVNGSFAASLSVIDPHTTGVRIGRRSDPPRLTHSTLDSISDFADGFHALNRAAERDPALVIIEPDTRSDATGIPTEPFHIVHVTVPGDAAEISHPSIVIDVGERGRLNLIETYTGLTGPAVVNASTTLHLGRAASVTHHRIQTEAPGMKHIGHTRVTQATDSTYDLATFMLGADIARHTIEVTLNGANARAGLTGLYRPAGHQRHDIAVCVDHAGSHGTSTQEFKGIIDDHARGSFSGRIIVRPNTVANDAQQRNRNLVLEPTAQADSRPWLEIFADDVRCTHGSTVGRLDDEALFYLRSRGIPLAESRSILIDAFVHEITDVVEPASLRDYINGALSTSHGVTTREWRA